MPPQYSLALSEQPVSLTGFPGQLVALALLALLAFAVPAG